MKTSIVWGRGGLGRGLCVWTAAVGFSLFAGCGPSASSEPADGSTGSGSGGAGAVGMVGSGGTGSGGATGSGGRGSSGSGGAVGTGGAGGSIGAASGGSGLGSGGSGGTAGAAGAGAPNGLAMFVAGGYRGRTTISCDDGASWVANHSDDDSVCPNHDCGEVANTITGVTYGDGYFFISRGWGMPGNVLRSADGVIWSQIHSGDKFGGVAYGSGTLVVAGGWQSAWYSTNAGQTLTRAQDFSGLLGDNTGNIRNASYHPYGGGRFILVPDNGAGMRKFAVSKDLGKSYTLGTTTMDICASRVTDVVSGGNTIVSISEETGYACRSLDGGASWSGKQISTAGLSRQMAWTGTEFLVYGGGSGYRSADGETWTKFALTPAGLRFGALVRSSATGTIVATTPYGSDYGAQAFYRSSDGVTWQSLAAGKFVGSHLIEHMTFGYGQRSTACP